MSVNDTLPLVFDGPPDEAGSDFEGIHTWTDLVSFFIVYVAGTIAAGAGVGGGAIYTPLYIALFGLVYEAIPLSKAAVLGAALSFVVETALSPVPKDFPNRFAYDAVMVMEPSTLMGVVFGVLLSRMFPMWLITLLMTSILTLSSTKTFDKAAKLYAKETKLIEAHRQPEEASEMHLDTKRLLEGTKTSGRTYGSSDARRSSLQEVMIIEDYGYSSRWLGWRCLVSVGTAYLTVLTGALLGDDQVMDNAVPCGSFWFWGVLVIEVVIAFLVTVSNVRFLVRHNDDQIRKQCAVEWTVESGTRYSLLCFAAGVASSLCGIGGSTIKNPILVASAPVGMNLPPRLARDTSQLMLLTTVSSSAFQFMLSGQLPPVYGSIFFVIGALAGFTGKWLVDKFVARYGRQSTIVYLLAWYIVFAIITMTSISVIIVLSQITPQVNWEQLGFRDICEKVPDDLAALKWLETFTFSVQSQKGTEHLLILD